MEPDLHVHVQTRITNQVFVRNVAFPSFTAASGGRVRGEVRGGGSVGSARKHCSAPPSPLPRTNRTSLVPLLVLSGHAVTMTRHGEQQGVGRGRAISFAADPPPPRKQGSRARAARRE